MLSERYSLSDWPADRRTLPVRGMLYFLTVEVLPVGRDTDPKKAGTSG